MTTDGNLRDFGQRINEICDDMKVTADRGRQAELARHFGVTPKAARKWLLGVGYPEMGMAVKLSNWADVNLNWLLQGHGPKRGDRVDVKATVLDSAIRELPRELGIDLIDNLRSKLQRTGKVRVEEPAGRYQVMLDAYEQEIKRKKDN